MGMDSLELQLASAVLRYSALQRKAEAQPEPDALLQKALAELGTALEEVRVAQEQLIEDRTKMERLQEHVRDQSIKYRELFDELPYAYVVTKPDSTITEANKAAAEMFNVGQRFLVGKTLSVFVCENRARFLNESSRIAGQEGPFEFNVSIRPRERAPFPVVARVSGMDSTLRWILRPAREF